MKPFVSIIIVNFNGRHLLGECLRSLFDIDYPAEKFEVIIVDNNSSDNSVGFVKSNFPEVRIIASPTNLGFTGGNNMGIHHSKGEYVVLLNSDTTVDEGWLQAMVSAAKKNPQAGVVSPKILYAVPFVELTIKANTVLRSEIDSSTNFTPLGVLIEDITCSTPELDHLIFYETGFYEKEKAEISARWTKAQAKVLLPLDRRNSSTQFSLTVHGYQTGKKIPMNFQYSIANGKTFKETLLNQQVKQFTISVDHKTVTSKIVWLVQNAGSLILRDGHGKDRGSLIYTEDNEHVDYYERNSSYYSRKSKLMAFCGASCLFKKTMLKEVGLFHNPFFMYYEDLDLSLRTIRQGWEIIYQPKAIVYHKHRQSTKTIGNYFFFFHVEKNHLIFLSRHFSLTSCIFQLIFLFIRIFHAYLAMTIYIFSENLERYDFWSQMYRARKDALAYILKNIPDLIQDRLKLQSKSTKSYNQIAKGFY